MGWGAGDWMVAYVGATQRSPLFTLPPAGALTNKSTASAVTAFVFAKGIAALFHRAGKDVDHASVFSRCIAC